MARSGDGIYEDDTAADQFADISNLLEREINYCCLPEKVTNHPAWLAQVLTVVELMLLFDMHDMGSTVYIDEPQAVIRWREAFLQVWDGDWKPNDSYSHLPYNERNYRKQHRPGVVALFDRLESIALDWKTFEISRSRVEITPLPPDYSLPYFSLNRVIYHDNKEIIHIEYFLRTLIETHVQEITYWLAYEHWIYVTGEEILVAVDVLGFLCEIYDQPPIISQKLVQTWRTSTIQIFKDNTYGEEWGESDAFYQNVMKSFDRLETMAKKYPPIEW